MNIVPFNENVLVRPFPKVDRTEGGVIIPDTVQERPQKATVLAVSAELTKKLTDLLEKTGIDKVIKKGDTVYHVKNCGVPIEGDNGEQLFMLRYVECLAKFSANGSATTNDSA